MAAYLEDLEIIKALRLLSEEDLRKLVRAFFAREICNGNVQPLHGTGEHGKDVVAVIDSDDLGRKQILFVQVKKGDVSLPDWANTISGQMLMALNTQENQFPMGTSKDSPRRLLLLLSGEVTPEAFGAIRDWNRAQHVPVEVFNIFDLINLLKIHGIEAADFQGLLDFARTLDL